MLNLVHRSQVTGVVISLVALVGCGTPARKGNAPDRVPTISVATARSGVAITEIQGVGTAAWRRETPLGFTTGGQIARVLVNEGERVRRGQLLAILSAVPVEAELAVAQAEANRAASEVNRLGGLYRDGWVTKARFETAQASAAVSAAQVKARRFALDTAKVVAPSDGVVLSRLAEPTQVVAAGTPVVIVGEAAGGYVIRVPVNDRAAAALTIGAPASVGFEALGPAPLPGRVVEIGGKARQSTGTFDVEISLPANPRLRSGMIGTASMTAAPRLSSSRTLIPATALIAPRAGEALVYVIDAKNIARLRKIVIGDTTDTGVEVLSGITTGERIALSGFEKIKDGTRVSPVIRTR